MNLPVPSGSLSGDDIIRLFLDVQSDSVATASKDVEQLGKSLDKAAGHQANFGRATLESGRILQDFAQGGIGGILNNIEGLSVALGGGPGLAGIMTAVGLAAYFAIPAVKSLWAQLSDGSNEVPKALDPMVRLNKELKENKDRQKELEDQHKLTNTQVAEYNRLTNDQVRLEKEINEEKKKRATLDKLREKDTTDEKRSAAEVAAAFEGQNVDAIIGTAEQGLRRESQATGRLGSLRGQLRKEMQALAAQQKKDPFDLVGVQPNMQRRIAALQAQISAEEGTIRGQAESLVAGAAGGDARAISDLAGVIPEGEFRQGLVAALPVNLDLADREVAEAEDFGRRAHAGSAKFRRAYQQQIDQDKLSNQLTEKGRQVEAQMWREKEAADRHDEVTREHERKKAEHDAEKRRRENTPQATNRRQQEALEDEALGIVQKAAPNMLPGPQAAVAKHMLENYQSGLAIGHTVQEQLDYAIRQTRLEIMNGVQAGLKRQNQAGESRMAP